jgi:hypothetical protein
MANPHRFRQDIKLDPPDTTPFSLNNPKISGVNSGEMKDIKGMGFYHTPNFTCQRDEFGL